MSNSKFSNVLAPGRIGSITLRNRIVLPAMVTSYCGIGGEVTQQMIDYQVERAKGGVGLQILESCYITSERGVARLLIDSDHTIPGLHEIVESIQEHDGVVFAQLNHQGKLFWPEGKTFNSLTKDEILALQSWFLSAAIRVQKAGFDGIELHAAHGYLLNQTLSRRTNKREDEYGFDMKGRSRFLVEVLKKIKASLGSTFPLIVRINGNEHIEEGITLEEAKEIARILECNGADAIHVSSGNLEFGKHWVVQPMSMERGCLVPLAEEIKKGLTIPVITVGRINDPQLAEEIIASQKADFVAIGRGLISDPHFVNKMRQGRENEIRKCVACNFCVGQRHRKHWKMQCAINAKVGKERSYSLSPAANRKKILVVGGGPAGIECSTTLAKRGHEVLLFESQDSLGGNLRFAFLPPHKDELRSLLSYQIESVYNSDVHLHLGQEVTAETIQTINPDEIIFATGSSPISIAGFFPVSKVPVYYGTDILSRQIETGNRVAVIGGGQIGCEVAELLAFNGKSVHIIEIKKELAEDLEGSSRHLLLDRLDELNITIHNESEVLKAGKIVEFKNSNGQIKTIEVDSIVAAVGYQSNRTLYDSINRSITNIHLIGDCKKVRDIAYAIHTGAFVARNI